LYEKKGCYWGGVTKTGIAMVRRKAHVAKKKRDNGRGARKGKDAVDAKGKARAGQSSKGATKAPRSEWLVASHYIRANSQIFQNRSRTRTYRS
jgi:hypothetical protein